CFFFQAEDGIRDFHVTGVQTCALPIYRLGIWLEVSAYPSPSGLSVFFKDISGRKMNEEKLKKINKELALSNSELEQFAFVASHDLQEPLRMITSFLAQLEKKYNNLLDEKGKRYIHRSEERRVGKER